MNNPNGEKTLKRAYQFQNIEKAFTASVRVQGNTSSSLTNTVNATSTVSDLFSLVKPVNPLVLNEDGTPKVFYHSTNENFTVFKKVKGQDFQVKEYIFRLISKIFMAETQCRFF